MDNGIVKRWANKIKIFEEANFRQSHSIGFAPYIVIMETVYLNKQMQLDYITFLIKTLILHVFNEIF